MAGALTVIVGLPGAGKSSYLNKINRHYKCHDFHAGALDNSSEVEKSRYFAEVVDHLIHGRNSAIADIAFCSPERRANLERVLGKHVPNLKIEWVYFENSKTKCEKNVRNRNRRELNRDLQALEYWARVYVIPNTATPITVWDNSI